MAIERFETLALSDAPALDRLALALAAEFRAVDAERALERLDEIGLEIAATLSDTPRAPHREAAACRVVLGERRGFCGDRHSYGDPSNSMLDSVLERCTGLPITLSIVYIEAARRAGVDLRGVGLPGHFVVGHFGAAPPLLLDPFDGGALLRGDPPGQHLRPWSPQETAQRMLSNLIRSYSERGDVGRALHAADLRDLLPADTALREQQEHERSALMARLN